VQFAQPRLATSRPGFADSGDRWFDPAQEPRRLGRAKERRLEPRNASWMLAAGERGSAALVDRVRHLVLGSELLERRQFS